MQAKVTPMDTAGEMIDARLDKRIIIENKIILPIKKRGYFHARNIPTWMNVRIGENIFFVFP